MRRFSKMRNTWLKCNTNISTERMKQHIFHSPCSNLSFSKPRNSKDRENVNPPNNQFFPINRSLETDSIPHRKQQQNCLVRLKPLHM
ncbi:hypothetical protein CDAR_477801 [Caerostris darwini]|uniref:Uncharacterized protein n=1 Tax=Caerostris darwini TaxID=1538125 RepID=A0AAV4Q1X4_9ARAC|nr:hypothetical protein CDAR_477801 [Caerostris darwini]